MGERYRLERFPEELSVEIVSGNSQEEEYHRHDGYRLTLILKGRMNIHIDAMDFPLSRGSLILLRPEAFHRMRYNGECQERVVVSFSRNWLETHSSDKTALLNCFYRMPPEEPDLVWLDEQQIGEFMILARRLQNDLKGKNFGDDILADCHGAELVLLTDRMLQNKRLRPENRLPQLVQEVLAYVQEHIHEPIHVEELAASMYHNRSHVSRVFKEHMGVSLQQYIIDQRLNIVMRILREGGSLTEAAESAGFANYANFIRTFTKHIGISPGKYQRMVREMRQEEF